MDLLHSTVYICNDSVYTFIKLCKKFPCVSVISLFTGPECHSSFYNYDVM